MPRIAALVLAAGSSRRMGSPKALLPLGGVPMIARVVQTLRSLPEIQPMVVVTGHRSNEVAAALNGFPVQLIHNADYLAGEMLSSIKLGAAALFDRCDAFFLVLGDQPLVKPSTYQTLWNAQITTPSPCTQGEGRGEGLRASDSIWNNKLNDRTLSPPLSQRTGRGSQSASIIQPTHNQTRGHPLLLPATAIEQILALPRDATLKNYTQRTDTIEIPVDDPGILTDIDTPEDYDRAVELLLAQSRAHELNESVTTK